MSTRLAVAALGVLSLGIIALTVLGVLAYIDLRDRVYAAESSVNDLSSTVYENSNAVYSRLAQLDNLEYQMLDLKDDLEGMQSQVNGIKPPSSFPRRRESTARTPSASLSPKNRTGPPHDINPLTGPRPPGTINQAQAGD